MFLPHKSDNGLQPFEYYPAAAGTYEIGQLLNVSNGQLVAVSAASNTTPAYVCMAKATVEDGEALPVIRVNHEMIFATTLSAEAANAKLGTKLQVSAGGTQVDGAAAGTFEVTYIEDTAKDSVVHGRFQ